jgi:hypothetical protein
MEVLPAFVGERQGAVEQIHHQGLAAADAAPQIQAAHGRWAAAREASHAASPAAWRRRTEQIAIQAFQRFDGARLRRVGR